MKRQLMAEEWNEFARRVLPDDASLMQRNAMRRSFYAGGYAILFRVIQGFTSDAEPTIEDLELMNDLHDELTTYFAGVIKE
jgi:hypothetical protein